MAQRLGFYSHTTVRLTVRNTLQLLSLDPGGTTGLSVWEYNSVDPLQLVFQAQVSGGLEGFLEWLYPFDSKPLEFDIIVSESFRLDGRTPNPDVTPLRIEGALTLHQHNTGTPVFLQANNMKAHVDNDRLKAHDLYFPGKHHAMDSIRHALAYMKRTRHLPTLEKYFKD